MGREAFLRGSLKHFHESTYYWRPLHW